MKRLIVFLIVVISLMFVGCYEDPGEYSKYDFMDTGIIAERHSDSGVVIMVMGDSRGYFGKEWDGLNATIYNVSFGSTTMYGVMHRLPFVKEIRPDYVIIFGGVNEARHTITFDEWKDVFDSNIQSIIDDGAIPILCDPFTIVPEGGESITRKIRQYLRESYSEYYFDSDTDNGWFSDHVHFSSVGYTKISNDINAYINNMDEI